MSKLIEALQIFLQYADEQWPTHCEHDILCIIGINKNAISNEHKQRLDELGFFWNDEYDCWASFMFGSA